VCSPDALDLSLSPELFFTLDARGGDGAADEGNGARPAATREALRAIPSSAPKI
jgi:hypothetical protein